MGSSRDRQSITSAALAIYCFLDFIRGYSGSIYIGSTIVRKLTLGLKSPRFFFDCRIGGCRQHVCQQDSTAHHRWRRHRPDRRKSTRSRRVRAGRSLSIDSIERRTSRFTARVEPVADQDGENQHVFDPGLGAEGQHDGNRIGCHSLKCPVLRLELLPAEVRPYSKLV